MNSIHSHNLHCYHLGQSLISLLDYGFLTSLFASAFFPTVYFQYNSQSDASKVYVKSCQSTWTLQRLPTSLRCHVTARTVASHTLCDVDTSRPPAPLTSSSLLSISSLCSSLTGILFLLSHTKRWHTSEPLDFSFLCLNHSFLRYHITFSDMSSRAFF